MQLEDYFDMQAPDDIRLKGTRVGIETVLYDFIFRSRTPEQIARTYPSLTIEQVYATITYYYHNRQAVDAYLAAWLDFGDRMRAQQALNPSPTAIRLRALAAERHAAKAEAG
jgi:uncharacterized protein (DUF433 family)